MDRIFKVIAVNEERTEAYAEWILDYKPIDENTVYITDRRGSCHFAWQDQIVINPEIIRECSGGCLFKIKWKDEN